MKGNTARSHYLTNTNALKCWVAYWCYALAWYMALSGTYDPTSSPGNRSLWWQNCAQG